MSMDAMAQRRSSHTRVVGQVLRHLRGSKGSPTLEPAAEPPAMLDQLSRLIEAKMAEYRTTGVAFGIYKDGKSACRAFGITNIDNPQPVTTNTVFPSEFSLPREPRGFSCQALTLWYCVSRVRSCQHFEDRLRHRYHAAARPGQARRGRPSAGLFARVCACRCDRGTRAKDLAPAHPHSGF